MRQALIVLVVLIVIVGIVVAVRARSFNDRVEAEALPLFVPVVVTPSIQPVDGQVLLFKATNLSERPVNMRLMLYNDRQDVPGIYKDFMDIPAGNTVSYLHEPPKSTLTLGATTVDAPEAVRAVFAPVPGDDPGAIRRVTANVQLMRIRPAEGNAAPMLDAPIVVPLERCNFEPRGFVPYTGGQWWWNCAPQMFPIHERWRQAGEAVTGRVGGTVR